MKSQIERLWPRDDEGNIIFQSHPGFDDFNISNDDRLAMLRRDDEIRNDTQHLWKENYGYDVYASHSHDPYKIKSIKLPFTPEVWVDLCNSQGEFLPMCCANISSIRDMLMGALREGGYIDCEALSECARLAEEHGWDHDLEDEDQPDAVMELIKLWKFVEPFADAQVSKVEIDPNSPKDACRILNYYAGNFIWDCLNDRNSEEGEAEFKRCRIHSLTKILPAIATVYHKMRECDPGVLEGWAICKGDEVMDTFYGGPAIFAGEEFAQRIAERWMEQDAPGTEESRAHKREEVPNYTVKHVRLSLDNGVEFIN